ncbi:hypothetical protein VNO78_03978 [Psophocarpus tetragonolobus]|uniref:Uncharacterized protein n=1 Tax=Psophocarpus tetragonolobus TaxID=3891 RepID=A0AAN9XXF8_PSOTE
MLANTKPWLVLSLLLLAMLQCVYGKPQVHCFYVFGDSLSDNGNNNNLETAAKANYAPYGIDSTAGPTGRFCNGLNTIDYTCKLLGFKECIPPHANANTGGSDILQGLNYASGAAGIRPESGKHLGDNIDLGRQIGNHRAIYWRIVSRLGGFRNATQYFNKCLYYVNIGNNDYINNYFLPQRYPRSRIYTVNKYTDDLIHRLSRYIKVLHELGARKYVVCGTGLIGCTPNAISRRGTNGSLCVDELNAASFIFNSKLKSKVDKLKTIFTDSKFVFINGTDGTLDASLGFTVVNAPCCPTREDGQCVPNSTPCPNRRSHVFYDEYHPTTRAAEFIALGSYNQYGPHLTH